MRLLFIGLCFWGILPILMAQARLEVQDSLRYSRVRIWVSTEAEKAVLESLGLDCHHGHHRAGVFIENDYHQGELRALKQAGLRYEVLIRDVVKFYQERSLGEAGPEQQKNWLPDCGSQSLRYQQRPPHFRLGTMGGFFTYQDLIAELERMASVYPHLISRPMAIDSSNRTAEGRVLHWVRISDNPNQDEAHEPEMLFTGLHHSREPLSAMQLIYFMWFLLDNYDQSSEIQHLIDHTQLYFIPCVNPDGYAFNSNQYPQGGGLWRKNRKRNADGTIGVDLNRNYGKAFGFDDRGSSPTPSAETYRGPYAFSEAETQNIRDFCISRRFELALNYHSYGNMLIYPWAYNSGQTADSTAYRYLAPYLTRENRFMTGTNNETVGYSSNGDADDWFYDALGNKPRILSMTPEAGYQDAGFWPARQDIEWLCKLNLWQNLRYAQSLLNLGDLADVGSPFVGSNQFQVEFSLRRYGFRGGQFYVRLRSQSPYVLSIGPNKSMLLQQFESKQDSIEVVVSPSTPSGSVLTFLLDLDQGEGVIRTDTIYRFFGPNEQVFAERFDQTGPWINLGAQSNWGLTNESYYSPSFSLTDSPRSLYPNNAFQEVLLNVVLDLSQAEEALLRFRAKWDIERNYDYVQILASANGQPFEVVCGEHTRLGGPAQDPNQPLYDGYQGDWILETINLKDYVGQSQVLFKWRLVSDRVVQRDGFYLDDLSVETLEGPIVSTTRILQLAPNAYPNPASERIYLPLPPLPQGGRVCFYDLLGRLHDCQELGVDQVGLDLSVKHWPKGWYVYRIESRGGIWKGQKIEVKTQK